MIHRAGLLSGVTAAASPSNIDAETSHIVLCDMYKNQCGTQYAHTRACKRGHEHMLSVLLTYLNLYCHKMQSDIILVETCIVLVEFRIISHCVFSHQSWTVIRSAQDHF